jgi:hypothetical protein
MKKAWAFYLLLICAIALVAAIYGTIRFTVFYGEAIAFFDDKIKTVEFSNGQIINMPISHKELQFKNWTIFVDTIYVDEDSIQNDLDKNRTPALFIGPKITFIVRGETPIAIDYPQSFSSIIDTDLLTRYRLYLIGGIFLFFLIGIFIYKFIVGFIYVSLVIAPVVLFKFRRMGLAYRGAFQAGLYLISIQLLVSIILLLAEIYLPWSFLWFILFYIFYIGACVNIDISKSRRRTAN